MIKYAYSSFANTYFSFYHGRTTKTLSLMQQVLASSTLERLAAFIVSQIISPMGKFHLKPRTLC
jgi:hypothetical protein